MIDVCAGKTLGITTHGRLFNELGGNINKELNQSTANLIIFAMRGHERKDDRKPCTQSVRDLPIAVITMDGRFPYINETKGDQGMIPPPVKRVTLTQEEEQDIQTCAAETKKRFHVSYVGNFRSNGSGARSKYKDLHDNNKIIILRYFMASEMQNSTIANLTYEEVLKMSEFGLSPRGDNKYSFRFTEVLSAGTIPIYHADDYVYPFRPEVVDWQKCAIILPEKMAGQPTLDFIANMTTEERCKRRQYCYFDIYKQYIETPRKMLNGYINGLESMKRRKMLIPFAGVRCNSTLIQSKECYDQ